MNDGPESQTYTRLRRDALAARAANQPAPPSARGRKKLALVAVGVVLVLAVAAKLFGLF